MHPSSGGSTDRSRTSRRLRGRLAVRKAIRWFGRRTRSLLSGKDGPRACQKLQDLRLLRRRVPRRARARRRLDPVDPAHEEPGVLGRADRVVADGDVDRAGRPEWIEIEDGCLGAIAVGTEYVLAAP